jgi:hypothetical protein
MNNIEMGNTCCHRPQIPNINIKDVCENIHCYARSSCCIRNQPLKHHHHKHHHHNHHNTKNAETQTIQPEITLTPQIVSAEIFG